VITTVKMAANANNKVKTKKKMKNVGKRKKLLEEGMTASWSKQRRRWSSVRATIEGPLNNKEIFIEFKI
jgi:hypothetical protein